MLCLYRSSICLFLHSLQNFKNLIFFSPCDQILILNLKTKICNFWNRKKSEWQRETSWFCTGWEVVERDLSKCHLQQILGLCDSEWGSGGYLVPVKALMGIKHDRHAAFAGYISSICFLIWSLLHAFFGSFIEYLGMVVMHFTHPSCSLELSTSKHQMHYIKLNCPS